MNHLQKSLQSAYLDYCNDFISVDKFAQYYVLDKAQALQVIELGRAIHEAEYLNRPKKTA